MLAQEPHLGKAITGFPTLLGYFIKWKNARHGHHIIFRRADDGIQVVRILHSAMDTPRHLDES